MTKIGIVALLVLMVSRAHAQQNYFVLIQADNSQQFYARIGAKTFSSSAQGHLIIPQLKDSIYHITIGFPKKLFPEQQFSITINKKDLEFDLKNLGEKGWGLYNPLTMEMKTPDNRDTASGRTHPEGVKKDDAFSRLMAGVVSDTAVMYNTYSGEEPPKDTLVRKESRKDDSSFTPVAKRSEIAGTAVPAGAPGPAGKGVSKKAQPPANPESLTIAGSPKKLGAPKKGEASNKGDASNKGAASNKEDSSNKIVDVKKAVTVKNPDKTGFIENIGEQRTGSAVRLSYIEYGKGGKRDTIVVIIPVDIEAQLSPDRSVALRDGAEPGPVKAQPGAVSPVDQAGGGVGVSAPGSRRQALVNSDCRNFASDYDVDKLRVKMLSASKEDDKILAAKKVFRTKCFTTKQIRALSEVFTTDEGKFKLFEAAYPFVSDSEQFRELSAQLSGEPYINRFKKMVGAE